MYTYKHMYIHKSNTFKTLHEPDSKRNFVSDMTHAHVK